MYEYVIDPLVCFYDSTYIYLSKYKNYTSHVSTAIIIKKNASKGMWQEKIILTVGTNLKTKSQIN